MNFFENIMPDHAAALLICIAVISFGVNSNLQGLAPSIRSDAPDFGIGQYRLLFWSNIVLGCLFGVPVAIWLLTNFFCMMENDFLREATIARQLKFMILNNPELSPLFVVMTIGVFLIVSFVCHCVATYPFINELKQYTEEKQQNTSSSDAKR